MDILAYTRFRQTCWTLRFRKETCWFSSKTELMCRMYTPRWNGASGFASCVSVLDVPIKANSKLKSICHHSVADAFHFGLLANTMLCSSR